MALDRLSDALRACRDRGEKAMGLFLTSGFPERDATLGILLEIARAGADFVELGMPFSDPLAEGLPIQRSSERALKNGIRLEDTLKTAAAFRDASETPLVLMGYINPILQFGVARFCDTARDAGVDGLILPDLPLEESALVAGEAEAAGLALVHLIAPNTSEERIRTIDETTRGFVYAVSVTGLTGSGLGTVEGIERYLERARSLVVRNPLLVGFGIRTHEDAVRLSRHTDGFVVGSALVQLVERLWDDDGLTERERLGLVADFAAQLKYGKHARSEV